MSKKRVAVIGAGIIGLSTAYYLQKNGCQVVLIDKQEPGTGTSRGHASMIANYGVPGINQPQVWGQLPRYLFSKSSPIAIQWSKIGKLTPWLIQFLKNCNTTSMKKTALHTSSLLKSALPNYQELLLEIGAQNLLIHRGVLYVWIDPRQQPNSTQINIRSESDVEQIKLSGEEIRELEPNLSEHVQGGWHFPKAQHTLDPDLILEKLYQSFLSRGGQFQKEEITSIHLRDNTIQLNNSKYDQVVVCAGAFSKSLVKQIEGQFVPLEAERGYHIEFIEKQQLLSRPTSLVESGMYLTPLHNRLRAVGTVELGGLHKGISQARINYIARDAKRLLPALQEFENPWLGYRPTLPDCLPIIGKSPKHNNIFYAFGHNHLGWTLGPTTGKIITNLMQQNIAIDPAFSIERYL
ncbi:FAD-binding oxidoreductase [Alphaproteobacteria bacterium]|nr:FAD-binding oxidoreductase [Alphaproteobacteria bacterium]